jgi:hypothetical protein
VDNTNVYLGAQWKDGRKHPDVRLSVKKLAQVCLFLSSSSVAKWEMPLSDPDI